MHGQQNFRICKKKLQFVCDNKDAASLKWKLLAMFREINAAY